MIPMTPKERESVLYSLTLRCVGLWEGMPPEAMSRLWKADPVASGLNRVLYLDDCIRPPRDRWFVKIRAPRDRKVSA